MAHANGTPDTLEKHQYEVCNAFARAAVAMRDAAHTAENFSNWFSRVNNLQNIPVPPMFNGSFHLPPNLTSPQQQSYEPEQTGKKRKLAVDQEGKKKRQVKEKKPKDLNAPKRPPSAYLLFQNEVRKDVKAAHPDMPHSQLLTEISKLWAALNDEEKEPYMQATKDSKVLYEKAKADYDANPPKATETTEATGPSTKPSTTKSKTPVTVKSSVDKSAVKAAATGNDDDDDEGENESSNSSSDTSSEDNDEDEEEAPQPVPEPPRKKSKKEAVKAPAPPPVKVDRKKRTDDGKRKKKTDT